MEEKEITRLTQNEAIHESAINIQDRVRQFLKVLFGVLILTESIILVNIFTYFWFFQGAKDQRSVVYLYFVAINTVSASMMLAAVLAVTIFLQYRIHRSELSEIYLNASRKPILIGAALCPILAYIDRDVLFFFYGYLFDGEFDVQNLWFPLDDAKGFLAAFGLVPALFIAAFAEELFRGYMLKHLKRSAGILTAIVVSSLLFAAMHVFGPYTFRVLMPIFFAGVLFACMTLIARSIWPSVFAHCLSNLMAAVSLTSKADFGNKGVTALDPSTFPFH
jgi:membrane protease YdiL (CAAX protease family)